MAEMKVRNALRSDIPIILELAKSVGRYIGYEEELHSWFNFDSKGFFVAESVKDDEEKVLIGVCVGIALTVDRGFIGLYVTREELRGCGIGKKLWDAAKMRLGDRNIGICGHEKHFDKFWKKGFCFCKNYGILYYESTNSSLAIGQKSFDDSGLTIISLNGKGLLKTVASEESNNERNGEQLAVLEGNFEKKCIRDFPFAHIDPCEKYLLEPDIINIGIDGLNGTSYTPEDLIHGVVKYDFDLHGYDRSFIIKNTFSWKFCRTKIGLCSNRVVGYGCYRPVVTGHWLISPLYADSIEIAECILRSLLQEVDNYSIKSIVIRVPDTSTSFSSLLESLGFNLTDTRILSGYTKEYVRVDEAKIYSMHSTVFCSE